MRPLALSLVLLAACVPEQPPKDGPVLPEDAGDEDGDGFTSSQGDCDDGDAAIGPGAVELCNGVDDDCDATIDEDLGAEQYADADGDGFGDAGSAVEGCEPRNGFVSDATDCDDGDAGVFPGAPEACGDGDVNCDGEVAPLVTSYADADGDGFGDADAASEGCDIPEGAVADATDCDDTTAAASPGAVEACDTRDNDCDGEVDEGVTAAWYADADGDGWGSASTTLEACEAPAGYSERTGDCDDSTAAVSPDASETCNGADDDCDGARDEADAADATVWYLDGDGDGYGDPAGTFTACAAPAGYVANAGDCDDADAATNPDTTWHLDADADGYGGADTAASCLRPTGYTAAADDCDDTSAAISPAAAETCDGVDDDCDGAVDEPDAADASTWYADADGDGYGDAAVSQAACEAPEGYVPRDTDCDDTDAAINPRTVWHLDADGDGHGGGRSSVRTCLRPSGYTAVADDCEDSDPAISPSGTEVCDEVDNDCDDQVDEDATDAPTWYADADEDGYGDAGAALAACGGPDGYVSDATDCDDTDADTSPGAAEVCGGGDEDCDGAVDEDEVYGDADACAALGCDDLLAARPDAVDGRYWIDPNGLGAYEVTCDMTTDGGGWTLVVSADYTEVTASDPPDFDYDSLVWSGAGYGSAGDATHISAAWADTPSFYELRWLEDGAAWQEPTTLTGDLADATASTGVVSINVFASASYGPYGGRLYRSLGSAVCNTGNASTPWGAGLGAVRSCQHTYGTLYYEFASTGFTTVELWIR